jgi:hypothetical protein
MAPSVFAVLVISKIWPPRFVVSTASTAISARCLRMRFSALSRTQQSFRRLSSCRPVSATTGGCRGSVAGLLELGYYKCLFVVLICSRGRT